MIYRSTTGYVILSFNQCIKHQFKQDVFVKLNAPDNGQLFQRRPTSQGQIF